MMSLLLAFFLLYLDLSGLHPLLDHHQYTHLLGFLLDLRASVPGSSKGGLTVGFNINATWPLVGEIRPNTTGGYT